MEDHTNIDDSEQVPAEDDDPSLDVAGKMQRIRARFKLVTVQLGIPHFSLKQVMDEAACARSEAASAKDEKAPEQT